MKDYNNANRKVAILCNHKRTVAGGHAAQMEKMGDRIKALYYQEYRIKQMMLDLDPKLKKKKGEAYFALKEGIDDEWVKAHQDALVEEQREKIRKKFEKENEKLVAEGQKEMKPKELDERLKAADELADKFKDERKRKKIEAEGKSPSIEKFEQQLEKLDTRIATMKTQSEDREQNKDVALGTSKIVSLASQRYLRKDQTLFPFRTLRDNLDLFWLTRSSTELHRSPPHRRLLQEVQRPHRALLLQDPAREVRMGHQIRG